MELKLKTPWRNGTTHLVMRPLEFMQRMAALVPRPRLHLIRFHDVLAPKRQAARASGAAGAARAGGIGHEGCPCSTARDERGFPWFPWWSPIQLRAPQDAFRSRPAAALSESLGR